MFIKQLIQFGLTEKEARIYLAALGLGETLASSLSKKTGISRPTIYGIIANLVKKGLMSNVIRNKINYFYVLPPKYLIEIGEQTLKIQQNKLKNIALILPELELLFQKTKSFRPKIEYYEGDANINRIYQDICKQKNVTLSSFLSDQKLLNNDLVIFHQEYNQRRVQNNIFHQILLPQSEKGLFSKNGFELTEIKLIPNHLVNFNSIIHLYPGKVNFLNINKQNYAIVIENQEIAATLSSIFDYFWQKAIKYE